MPAIMTTHIQKVSAKVSQQGGNRPPPGASAAMRAMLTQDSPVKMARRQSRISRCRCSTRPRRLSMGAIIPGGPATVPRAVAPIVTTWDIVPKAP
jgi:hypothetical protein